MPAGGRSAAVDVRRFIAVGRDVRAQVALTPGGQEDHEITGTPCSPRRAEIAQVLLHAAPTT
jgi:hypothetical protein